MKFIMKNIACMLSFVLAFILVFSFADINVQAASGKKKNVVVLYFSATGTTKGVAQRIQNKWKTDRNQGFQPLYRRRLKLWKPGQSCCKRTRVCQQSS